MACISSIPAFSSIAEGEHCHHPAACSNVDSNKVYCLTRYREDNLEGQLALIFETSICSAAVIVSVQECHGVDDEIYVTILEHGSVIAAETPIQEIFPRSFDTAKPEMVSHLACLQDHLMESSPDRNGTKLTVVVLSICTKIIRTVAYQARPSPGNVHS